MTDAIVRAVLDEINESAKTENFSSIVVSVTTPMGNYYKWTSGKEDQQIELIAQLYDRMREIVDNWKPFAFDPTLDASHACYHMGTPGGFDFLTWLMMQELVRIDAEAPGPLKIAFWQGRNPQPSAWIDTVYRPLVKMIGAVEDDTAMRRMGADVHVTRSMVALWKCGAKLPKLTAAIDHDGLPRNAITITLRECDYHPHRNSDLMLWYEFSKWLGEQGERVVFVRDTAKANDPLPMVDVCPTASKDLDARMWLYEHSKMNFFVSNGPMMMAVLTDHVPYLTFVMPEEMDSTYDANKPTFWKLKMGVVQGEQFPWATQNQRIVWQKPDLHVLRNAYNQWRLLTQPLKLVSG